MTQKTTTTSKGFVKLHRELLEWEWYDDINVCRLFTHLLLKANHKDNKYQGLLIKRGQVKTGRIMLAKETGLSQQQVRTCLTKLKSTSEITSTIYRRFSIISITNWDRFQLSNQLSNQLSTSYQPAINHKQEGKESKEGKEKLSEEDFASIYLLYKPKAMVIPDKKSPEYKRTANVVKLLGGEEAVRKQIKSYLDYLKIETWRKKKGYAPWMNDSECYDGDFSLSGNNSTEVDPFLMDKVRKALEEENGDI